MSKLSEYKGIVNVPAEKRGKGKPIGTHHPDTAAFLVRLSRAAGIVNKVAPILAVDDEGDFALEVEILTAISHTLDPARRAELYMKILDYIVPKRKAIEVSGPDGGPIELDYSGLAEKFDRLVSDSEE